MLNRVNWIGTITISQSWRYTTIILHIGDMLLEYIFLHFGPTHSVYEFGIFHVRTYLPRSISFLPYVARPALRHAHPAQEP